MKLLIKRNWNLSQLFWQSAVATGSNKMLSGKHIALGITGGIAAYKAALILRELKKLSARVTVIMTRHAQEFVTALTFEALSGEAVITGTFNWKDAGIVHIDLARQADLLLIAPATANIIGKLAHGIADDFLTTFYLAIRTPVLIAPAMNKEMYAHPVVQDNIRLLKKRGVGFIPPETGELACGLEGPGRLAGVTAIVERVVQRLAGGGSLAGKKILITAGPTREHIDMVRFISNPSSGRMGYALAAEAVRRGAQVTLISGPTELAPVSGASCVGVKTAQEMYQAVLKHFEKSDALIMTAAVADYTPAQPFGGKQKKGSQKISLELLPTVDILSQVSKNKGNRLLVGFAAEVENVVDNARDKLRRKGLDLIIANDISQPGSGFAGDTNAISIIDKQDQIENYPLMSKTKAAQTVLDKLEGLWRSRE
jgi:phosphopantothenoylcysteine decarboxylase/phosphopantothenate--cysteine ligase